MMTRFLRSTAILILLAAAVPVPARADPAGRWIALAKARDLAHQTQWLRLLHYENRWLGHAESPAMGSLFFLSPEGAIDPEAELEATLRGFFRPPTESERNPELHVRVPGQPDPQAPQCQFPARLMWLQEELGFQDSELPDQHCVRYRHFVETVAAKSVTLVFSSYYLNNPSSAFGHTFLRLNKGIGARQGQELLDYGINYAAIPDTGNALLYAFKGVAGLFPGTFTSVPYYYKVREYNDSESRDLWEYDLNFTPQQTAFLVAHLWELGSTWFRYYYVTKNCSYEILDLLDVVDPRLHLIDQLSWDVIPADTIKVLNRQPGLVRAVHYRPSIRTVLAYRLDHLSTPELDALSALLRSRSGDFGAGVRGLESSSLSHPEKIAVLDAAADYLDEHYATDLLREDPKAVLPRRWKQAVLLARSRFAEPSAPVEVPTPWDEMPQRGHGSRRITLLTGGSSAFGSMSTLEYRLALHDLTDPSDGYPGYAQLEMGKVRLRYNTSPSQVWLDDLTLFRILSLNPLHRFNHHLSWSVALEGKRFYDGICPGTCLGGSFEVGGGYAVDLSSSVPLTTYLLASGEFITSPSFPGAHFRPGIGPTWGLRYHPTERLGMTVEAGYRYRFLAGPEDASFARLVTRWAFRPDLAFSAELSQYYFANLEEGAAGVSYYY